MKKLITCFTLFSLLVLSSCSNDPILEKLNNFKNRIDYLKTYSYFSQSVYEYYGIYNLDSYYKNDNVYETLNIKGNLVYSYRSHNLSDNVVIEPAKSPYGSLDFNLINGNFNTNEYTSLNIKLNFKDSYIFFDINYMDSKNIENNINKKIYLLGLINLSFDFKTYLTNLDEFINEYYPKISSNENVFIEANVAKSKDARDTYFSYSNIESYYKTYLSVNRDIDTYDNLTNEGTILEYVSYFDIYPYVEKTNTANYFTNGQLEKISRIANYNNEDNSEIFIFNEEFSANRYEEYIYEEPNKIDYELIENTNLSNITLSYKSNLRDILNLLA